MTTAMNFSLTNGLSGSTVSSAPYVIYAHRCLKGVYVGYSKDPAGRWSAHKQQAKDGQRDDKFKQTILKGFLFKHFILAVAKTEDEALAIEAACIHRYGSGDMNTAITRPDMTLVKKLEDINFRDGEYMPVSLKRRFNRSGSAMKNKKKALAKVIRRANGDVSFRSEANENFGAGMKVSCGKAYRKQFNDGDVVSFMAHQATNDEGPFLAAMNQVMTIMNKSL